MPRVNDFQDSRGSLLQAALQNRSLNLQSDQAYLNAQREGQGLRQSMMQMMLADRLGRDQLGEGARQFDVSAGLREDELEETIRANQAREELTSEQIQTIRDRLAHDVDTRDINNALGVLDDFTAKVAGITATEARLAELVNLDKEGSNLTGADYREMAHLQQQLKSDIALAHDMISASSEIVGMNDEIRTGMTDTLKMYYDTQGLLDYTSDRAGEGNLNTPLQGINETVAQPSLANDFFHNIKDGFDRLFSGRNDLPSHQVKTHNEFQEIMAVESGRSWDESVEEDLSQAVLDFSEFGYGDRWLFTESEDRRNQNQNANMEEFEAFLNEAALARVASMGKDQGLRGNDLTEFVHGYMNNIGAMAAVKEAIMPPQVKRFKRNMGTLSQLQQAQTDVGQRAWLNALAGGPGAQQIIDSIRASLPAAQKLEQMRSEYRSGEATHYDPNERQRMEALFNNLVSFGIISAE